MIGLWTHAEIAVGIICSCLPVLPIFFQTMWPKIIIRKRPRLSILNGFKDLPSDFNGNSTGTLRQTYELHDHFHSSGQNEVQPMERGANTISHLTTQMIRPPPVFSRDVAMDTTCMEDRRNNRQILKTVTIETVLEPRDRLASDVEKKERPPWWSGNRMDSRYQRSTLQACELVGDRWLYLGPEILYEHVLTAVFSASVPHEKERLD